MQWVGAYHTHKKNKMFMKTTFISRKKHGVKHDNMFCWQEKWRERDSFSAQNCFPVYLNHREETQALLMGITGGGRLPCGSLSCGFGKGTTGQRKPRRTSFRTKNAQAFSFVGPQPHHSVSTRWDTLSPLVVTRGHKVLYKSRGKQNEILTVCIIEEAAMQSDSRSLLLG